jgi:hypothetical protein
LISNLGKTKGLRAMFGNLEGNSSLMLPLLFTEHPLLVSKFGSFRFMVVSVKTFDSFD